MKIDWGEWADEKLRNTVTYRVRFVACGRYMTYDDIELNIVGVPTDGVFVSSQKWITEALGWYQSLRQSAGLDLEWVI